MKFRSGLEKKVASQLDNSGVDYGYETETLEYVQPEKARKYTPDFIVNGIYIEVKGQLRSEDRQKMKMVKASNPGLDIRFVFGRAQNRITKRSKTTYAMWADKNGFPWADNGVIPDEWIS